MESKWKKLKWHLLIIVAITYFLPIWVRVVVELMYRFVKNIFKNQSGQFGLGWLIGIGASITMAFTGALITQSNLFGNKVDTVKVDVSKVSERTAKLEEAIKTLKDDSAEIKKDVKELLKRK